MEATEGPGEVRLAAEEVAAFWRDGHLALPRLTDEDDVAFLREIYDRLFRERAGRERGDHFDLAGPDDEGAAPVLPQILNPARYAPELLTSRLLANATTIARQLFGPDARCGFAHAILKPARHGAETPWHQDAAYWDPALRYRSASLWVPLQEATPENGCMEFVSGSHAHDVLVHRSVNGDPRVHALEIAEVEPAWERVSVRCPLPPGGATLHGPYTLHRTGPNRSDGPRRALILNAGTRPERRLVPLQFPWLAGQATARAERARRAATRGEDITAPPTGALSERDP